ncbi:MAG: hypothetical protein WAV28_18960 [Sedimentisphaerales bacterium]
MKRFFYGILGISVVIACICSAAPEPAIVPAPGQWTVDIQFTHPQQIVLPTRAENQPVRFWYVIITLTNNTVNDVGFYPKCDLMTDTFQITPEGKAVTSAVFEQIKKRHRSRYPFLEPLAKAGNRILQGEDNTKDIAIIWPDFDVQAKNIKVFIAGLSNETVAINHPVEKDESGLPLKVFLRKTLELSYAFKGDPALRSGADLTYKGKRWIMR